jgi:hypothetical protein
MIEEGAHGDDRGDWPLLHQPVSRTWDNQFLYNLANCLRTLALPPEIGQWSLTTLRDRLAEIGRQVSSPLPGNFAVSNRPERGLAYLGTAGLAVHPENLGSNLPSRTAM